MKKKTLKIIFIVLVVVFFMVAAKFIQQSFVFKKHRDYFKQPVEQQYIQDWMTFRTIKIRYDVDPEVALNTTLSFSDYKNQISTYCKKKKIDCSKVIFDLEKYKELNSNKIND